MNTKNISAFVILNLLAGCVSGPLAVNNLNKRQEELQAEIERLSSDLEVIRVERDEQISLMQQDIESIVKDYSTLKKRLDGLEKKGSFSDPSTVKSPDELYSFAESYYSKGKYEEAIIAYQKFIDANPNDRRVPDSYLKQGISLIKLGKKKEARYFLQTIIDKYPDSNEAKIARINMKILK